MDKNSNIQCYNRNKFQGVNRSLARLVTYGVGLSVSHLDSLNMFVNNGFD